ncbi:MAG: phosphoribosylglycinamide formyltransferase [Acidimicrobiia bacterium]
MRVGVLASGSGTILDAILRDGIPVAVVVVDRPCAATEVAESFGVAAELVERTDFSPRFDRAAYTALVGDVLRKYEVELVVMAGFGTIVPGLAAEFPNRLVNTHPALLPAFKGWHAVRDALAAGVKVTGWTAHLADEAVDEGTILAQEAVAVLPGDTEDSLHERIKQVERRRFPDIIRQLIEGTLP